MNKNDIIERYTYRIIRPESYYHDSGLYFSHTYFSYKCKESHKLTHNFRIIRDDMSILIEKITTKIKERYNINDTK